MALPSVTREHSTVLLRPAEPHISGKGCRSCRDQKASIGHICMVHILPTGKAWVVVYWKSRLSLRAPLLLSRSLLFLRTSTRGGGCAHRGDSLTRNGPHTPQEQISTVFLKPCLALSHDTGREVFIPMIMLPWASPWKQMFSNFLAGVQGASLRPLWPHFKTTPLPCPFSS